MARKISFINYKGGVGKTSVIVNLAACMVSAGHRVLLIDLDAQSNASIWIMKLERWNVLNGRQTGSVYSIFDPGVVRLRDCIQKDVIEDRDGTKLLPGLDLIPTTFQLIDIEHDYHAPPGKPFYLTFYDQIAEIEDNYDFILFDCPPNVLHATQCGLFSSAEIYVPSNPDALSLIGFTLLVEKLCQFQEISASFRTAAMSRPAEVQGIFFNAIKANVDIEVPKMRMQFRLNQFRAQQKAAQQACIFQTAIRDATVVRRAVTLGLPVILVEQQAGGNSVVDDYMNLTKELISHIATPSLATPIDSVAGRQ